LHFLDEMGGAKGFKVDHDNDAVRPALVLEHGEKRWPPPAVTKVEPAKPPEKAGDAKAGDVKSAKPDVARPAPVLTPIAATPAADKPRSHGHGPRASAPSRRSGIIMSLIGLALACAWAYFRFGRGDVNVVAGTGSVALLQHLTVFVMAVFVGFQVVWNVTPALHTPLMSVTNAISGIIVVGGLLGSTGKLGPSVGVAVVATLFATINIAGGFLVTRRMLAMFRK
jgi:NAD(P) transhydrogenase subunit alpha